MAKKTQATKNKYLDCFKSQCSNTDNIMDVIGGISVVNAVLLSTSATKNPSEVSEKEKQDIIQTYKYVVPFVDTPKKERKILENWFGHYPLLYRMAWIFMIEDEENAFNSFTRMQQTKMMDIVNKIWNLREDREIIAQIGEDDIISLNIPRTIRRQELEDYKKSLRSLFIQAFASNEASVTVNHGEKDGNRTICGMIVKKCNITPIHREILEEYFCTDENGEFVATPIGHTFVDWEF